jgi:hypothetical protein
MAALWLGGLVGLAGLGALRRRGAR